MNLREIKKILRALTPEQRVRLGSWLQELIATDRVVPKRAVDKREVIEDRLTDHRTYRLEGVRCGKESCKCAGGDLHGPYWYAYWSEGGRTKSTYVGKKLPSRKRSSSDGVSLHKQRN
jgi:hypothetical protein